MFLFGTLDVGMLGLKVLAVVGGFAVGAVSSGHVLRFSARLAANRKVPRIVLSSVQLLGGTTLGVAVWLWAFGPGGGGFGSSGGLGTAVSDEGQGTRDEEKPAESSPPSIRAQSPSPLILPDTLRVELLGGAKVKDAKFYLLEGESGPCPLAELRDRVRARMQMKGQPPLKTVELVIYEDSVAQDHPAVTDFDRWVRQEGLAVTLTFPRRTSP